MDPDRDTTDPTRVQVRTHQCMGLPFSLHVRGRSGPEVDGLATAMWSELDRWDTVFSPYRPDSALSRLADGRAGAEDLDPAIGEVLQLADEARARTNGVFDVRGAGRLDPSGIVKGWAAERVFRASGLTDAYLNAGGDLVVAGPAGGWRIGIEHPADPRGLLTAVDLGSGTSGVPRGLATSGRAHRGAHLWDPRTGRPAASRWQATVVGPSLLWADILATTAAVAGPDRLDPTGWPVGYQVLLADPTGTVVATDGFVELLAPGLPRLVVDRRPVHRSVDHDGIDPADEGERTCT